MADCPTCQTLNREGVRFCKVCGTPLHVVAAAASLEASTPAAEMDMPVAKGDPMVVLSPADMTPCAASHAPLLCAACGATLRNDARFCKACGVPVRDAGLKHEAVHPASLPCSHCGAVLRPGARFCKHCGRAAMSMNPQDVLATPLRSKVVAATDELLPLQQLADGRYVILEKIAQGGMGAVYRAQDRRISGRIVALKEMRVDTIALAERAKVIAAFVQEAELLARLQHPNLVRVTDRFQEGDRHYMVMEFIEGRTLQEILRERTEPFSETQVLAWAQQLCDVLAYLHGQTPPIIYRDIKPSNIMVVERPAEGQDVGTLKLIDFGIARFYKPGKQKDTIQFGTEGYAPPEQYGQAQTDARADIYALGVLLHQLLTLRDPTTELWKFPPVRKLAPSVSRRVETALLKAVELNKSTRHQSMAEFWAALSGEKPAWEHLAHASTALPVESGPPGKAALVTPVVLGHALFFGKIINGQSPRELTRELTVSQGGVGAVNTGDPWVVVRSLDPHTGRLAVVVRTDELRPGRLQLRGGGLKRWVSWHTARLVPTEREYQSYIAFQRPTGELEQRRVSVIVAPDKWQITVGWLLTTLCLLLELSIPLGVLWALWP